MRIIATPPARRRTVNLTPMIDVVFLLLVFFMLAARFGAELSLPVASAGAGTAEWQGPPRLIEVLPDAVLLNGVPVAKAGLADAVAALTRTRDDPVVLRARGADVARIVSVMGGLQQAGFSHLVLVE
ncbi:biopolymer transport protein ExbD [Rhodobacteraceae bacterium MBR-64]|jgi:biopolymer transport protein ExbD